MASVLFIGGTGQISLPCVQLAVEAGHKEREGHRGTGPLRDGRRGANKQTGADDGPDPECDKRPRPQRSFERTFANHAAIGHQAID